MFIVTCLYNFRDAEWDKRQMDGREGVSISESWKRKEFKIIDTLGDGVLDP